jgi:hypothetical protein
MKRIGAGILEDRISRVLLDILFSSSSSSSSSSLFPFSSRQAQRKHGACSLSSAVQQHPRLNAK